MNAATARPSAEDVASASRRYRSWGAQEREHADYCRITDRVSWRCWNYLGRHVEAASVALDMVVAATHRGAREEDTRAGDPAHGPTVCSEAPRDDTQRVRAAGRQPSASTD